MSDATPLWYGTRGRHDAPIVLVGEAWGHEEAQQHLPFVGQSGRELDRMLTEAGIPQRDVLFTNVCAIHPPGNDMWRLFVPRAPNLVRTRGLVPYNPVHLEVRRLYQQISTHPRKLVIGTGNYSLWALSDCSRASILYNDDGRSIPSALQTWTPGGIMDWRGSMLYCVPEPRFGSLPADIPFVPVIHPAAIMRSWAMRAPTVHDLTVRTKMALRGDWRPNPPWTIQTALSFPALMGFLKALRARAISDGIALAVDIETARSFITCLGIADSPTNAVVIPFIEKTADGFDSAWAPSEEVEIVQELRRLLTHPRVRIYGQNFIYDTQYIQHWLGITPNLYHDTMLAQNVLFPGTPKDLGYLSSLYCDYHWYWKEDAKEWNLKGNLDTLLRYNGEDCIRTFEIAERQLDLIRHLRQEPQMALKMRVNAMCVRMMNRGVRIDTKRRGALIAELNDSLNGIYEELLQIVPQELVAPDADKPWYRSNKQKQFLFYDQLSMRRVNNRKTGNATIGKEALLQLQKWYPEFSGLFQRLDVAGSVDNTVHVLSTPLDPDGRMRCSYNPGGTETHRLSSSTNAFGRGTNLQNLTKGEEDD
jgi:uracil-DNA glycosylase